MNLVVLCNGKRAEIPYSIPACGVNIYSVEELCYFFGENAFLLDKSLMNLQFAEWLSAECDLSELSEMLMPLCKGTKDVEAFVRIILEYTGYYPSSENEAILDMVRECADRSVGERKKTRADYYLENGKYELALKEYELLLKEREGAALNYFDGEIYLGMGVSMAKMFLFEQADFYLSRAYELLAGENVAFQMLAAKRLYLSEQKYISFVAEHPELFSVSQALEERLGSIEKQWMVSEKKQELDELKKCKQLGEAQLYYEEMDRMINRLKESFRQCMKE